MEEYYDEFEKMMNLTSESETEEEFIIIIRDLAPLFGVIAVVGFLTNCALLFVLPRTNVREAPNVFILSLALADLLVVAFVFPVSTAGYAAPSYPFHVAVCKMTEGLTEIAAGVTAFSLPALVAYCLLDGRETTLPSGKAAWNVAVCAIWTLAVLFAVPTMFTTQIHSEEVANGTTLMCLPNDPIFFERAVALKFAVYVATPLCAVGYFYAVAQSDGLVEVRQNVRNDFSRAALVLVLVYAVCFVPCYVVDLLSQMHYEHYNNVWHVLSLAGYCLTLVYRCLNPIALYYASVDFRRLFHQHVFFCCPLSDRGSETCDQRPLQGST